MIKCGFFNSVNGDRIYGANDLNNFFEGIVSDGVFRKFKREMEVTAPGGMAVRVLPGKAICMEKYIHITAAEDITVESGNAQPRYDAVVISVSLDDREGYLYIKKGEEAATPEPPALYDNDTVKEMALAYIYVPANATEILTENITDKREDSDVCGWVKAAATEVNIGISDYNATTDVVNVYKNGLMLNETEEYSINGTGSAAKIKLTSSTPAGNKFTFVVQHLGLI